MPNLTVASEWLDRQPARKVLFTDIDNTFVRTGSPYAQAAQHIRQLTAQQHIPLILVTGLTVNQVLARIESGELPQPEGICSSVGTQIWLRTNAGVWQKDEPYQTAVNATGFVADTVRQQAHAFIQNMPGYDLVFQPKNAQSKHKISLHFMATDAQAKKISAQATIGLAPYKVVTCQEINFNSTLPAGTERRKYCLDILPATKGDAIAALIQQLDIKGGWKAGDSGNDLDMLLHQDPLMPILVGGYTAEAGQVMLAGARHKKGSIYKLADGRIAYIETGWQKAGQSILTALDILQ